MDQITNHVPPTPEIPQTPPSRPALSRIVILSIVILIIGITVGLYINRFSPSSSTPPVPSLSPTTNEVTGWKTYTNSKWGYTLSYKDIPELKQFSCSGPLQEGDDDFIIDETSSKTPECGVGDFAWPITISTGQATDCQTTESFLSEKSSITVDGIESTRCVQKYTGKQEIPGQPDHYEEVAINKEGTVFLIRFTNPKYSETLSQILSSFKFLNVQSNMYDEIKNLYLWTSQPVATDFDWKFSPDDNGVVKINGFKLETPITNTSDADQLHNYLQNSGWVGDPTGYNTGCCPGLIQGYIKGRQKILIVIPPALKTLTVYYTI